jgi:predicted ABC-type ATPase
METKRLRIFAGPNGSGKSSLYSYLISQHYFNSYYYINADDIAKELPTRGFSAKNWPLIVTKDSLITYIKESTFSEHFPNAVLNDNLDVIDNRILWKKGDAYLTYIAASTADYLRYSMLDSGSSFSCETVFSHPSKLDFISHARTKGYKVYLYFISTESPVINIDRVQNRVKEGGHDVPEEKITERYCRTMNNLFEALLKTDRAYLFDNSNAQINNGYINFAEVEKSEIHTLTDDVPAWFNTYVLQKIH